MNMNSEYSSIFIAYMLYTVTWISGISFIVKSISDGDLKTVIAIGIVLIYSIFIYFIKIKPIIKEIKKKPFIQN